MTRDEMKDRISMALKAPVLQQGFEIICKENEELKEKVGKYQIGMFDEIEKRDKQLTKAKELLRKFLEAKSIEETCIIESEAEQFLKEICE